ncbi:MAG: hypothetical protein ABII88_03665 [Candidatus Omnitrophota bacterium]
MCNIKWLKIINVLGICIIGLCFTGNAFCANQMSADVYSFTIIEDMIAPSAVSNLAASSSVYNSVVLTWTATGDDNATGTAASYDIRYSTSPINVSNWASATQVSGEPIPGAAGASQNLTINGLTAETTYYFAIKVSDEIPNVSGLSNIANVTTPAIPDTAAPYTSGHSPAQNAVGVAKNTDIVVHLKDDGLGVDVDSIIMKVEGVTVSPVITGTPDDYTLTYTPPVEFDNGQVVNVSVEASDLAN